ncbi:CobW family GTP-binding protein [Tsukamurella soli]|uniref:GTP-binding protein n=1 Tax=Tsukamurella soli TaxID=644556 RepID=A0ABP8K4C6_9ACTN
MSARSAGRDVPVVVLAGYLGAGKSTLLNHLLRVAHGARIGVVVNDFGAVNIDAMLVAGQVDGAVAMSNGCLCCAVDDDELDDALARLAAAGMDAIVVEASGLAEPGALARRIAFSTVRRIAYGGLVYVVDAFSFADTVATHPSLRTHLAIADLVVLNKVDLAPDPDAVAVDVAASGRGAPVVPTVDGALDPTLLFDVAERPADSGPRQLTLDELLREEQGHACGGAGEGGHSHHEHAHLHDGYQAVDVTVESRLDARAVAALLEAPPRGVFRIKGFVEVGDGTRFEVHTVGRHVRTARVPGSGSVLVFVGRGIDADGVRASVVGCAYGPDGAPVPADRQATLSLLRFSPEA